MTTPLAGFFPRSIAMAVALAATPALAQGNPGDIKFTGYYQLEGAYTVASPDHGSKLRNRVELALTGTATEWLKWKLSGGAAYDAIFDLNDFYPPDVRKNQRFDAIARENYLDLSVGDFDFRLGRQHIIWGEVVSLFVADVVSAKDMREFVLPEFDLIRIPQWAARAEYFRDDFHAEVVWVPVMSYDKIGKPGADFYPFPFGIPADAAVVIENEVRPSRSLGNSAYGARVSYLKNGWDGSLFFYRSMDASPTFFRTVVARDPVPLLVFQPRHERIRQAGGTLSKDFESFVFKAEAVYTADRGFNVSRLEESDGIVKLDTLDYIVGLDFTLPDDAHVNTQLFQRVFLDHDEDIGQRRVESLFSVRLSKAFNAIEPELLLVSSLNRSDWMARPRIVWNVARNWRVAAGADFFGGPPDGVFGRFRDKDRIYAEIRRSF